jgi:hypothetical protein
MLKIKLTAIAAAIAATGALFAGTVAEHGPPEDPGPPEAFVDFTCEVDSEVVLQISVPAFAQEGLQRAADAVEEHHPAGVDCFFD